MIFTSTIKLRTKNLNLFLLLHVYFTFFGCKKITEEWIATRVSGRVINKYSAEKLSGIAFYITSAKEDWYYNTGSDTIETIYSDSFGNFDYEFHAQAEKAYGIFKGSDSNCYTEFGELLKKGEDNNLGLIKLSASAYLDFHIVNINPINSNDNICIHSSSYLNDNECISGNYVDSIIIGKYGNRFGNNYVKISWEVTKKGITSSYVDSIFLISCVRNLFNIKY